MAHQVRGGSVRVFQAVEQHVVTGAMGLAVERVVGEVVAAGERPYFGRAEVVRPAAAVQGPVRAQIVVIRRYVTGAAPFCACE